MTDSSLSFNIVDVLSGRNYPSDDIEFFVDEAAGFALARAEKKLDGMSDEEAEGFRPKVEALRAELAKQKFVITIRGIPEKIKNDLREEAYAKFPEEDANLFGIEKPNHNRNNFYTTILWQQMIEKIVAPNGAVQVNPDRGTIQFFRNNMPIASLEKIKAGIDAMIEDTAKGFDSALTDLDFLSEP